MQAPHWLQKLLYLQRRNDYLKREVLHRYGNDFQSVGQIARDLEVAPEQVRRILRKNLASELRRIRRK